MHLFIDPQADWIASTSLEEWHRKDIFDALQMRGWTSPPHQTPDPNVAGTSYVLAKDKQQITVSFIPGLGGESAGIDAIEDVRAIANDAPHTIELWLYRRRNSRWRAALLKWIDHIERTLWPTE